MANASYAAWVTPAGEEGRSSNCVHAIRMTAMRADSRTLKTSMPIAGSVCDSALMSLENGLLALRIHESSAALCAPIHSGLRHLKVVAGPLPQIFRQTVKPWRRHGFSLISFLGVTACAGDALPRQQSIAANSAPAPCLAALSDQSPMHWRGLACLLDPDCTLSVAEAIQP